MIDQKKLMQIIDRFDESRLTELNLESEDFKLVIKSEIIVQNTVNSVSTQTTPQALNANGEGGTVPGDSPSSEPDTNHAKGSDFEVITSPIVGTFYRSPAPDAPALVDSGSKVNSGASLCIIEAMKIMNKLEADFDCEIVNILVENGTMVEFGTPLFEVKRL